MLTTVSTPRLLLRRLQEQHRALVHQMDSNVDVVGADGVRSPEETDAFVSSQLQHWDRHGFGMWIAFDRLTLACVGRGGLRHTELEGQQAVQVGYGFFRSYWGQGLATELATAATHAGFDVLGLSRLVAIALPTNAASRRVLEKIGFGYVRNTVYEGLPHVLYERHRESGDGAGAHALPTGRADLRR